MIYLEDVCNWIETELNTRFDNYYIGILDNKKDKSLGIYNLKRNKPPVIAIGGLENTSYGVKQVSLLVHYSKSMNETEKIANRLFEEMMNAKPLKLGEHKVQFIGMLTSEAIDVGRDENGICEYVIEFEIYYKRNKEE